MAKLAHLRKALTALRKHALRFPETVEDFPWGHSAFKVKGKAFLFTYLDAKAGALHLSMKLPLSASMAVTLPFARPTPYGLGKSGWVTSRFNADDDVPVDMLIEWMDESFRAIAPKRVLALLEGADDSPPRKPKRKKKGNLRGDDS